jgi:hypothetical protein
VRWLDAALIFAGYFANGLVCMNLFIRCRFQSIELAELYSGAHAKETRRDLPSKRWTLIDARSLNRMPSDL